MVRFCRYRDSLLHLPIFPTPIVFSHVITTVLQQPAQHSAVLVDRGIVGTDNGKKSSILVSRYIYKFHWESSFSSRFFKILFLQYTK